eukprot:gene11101-3167_t
MNAISVPKRSQCGVFVDGHVQIKEIDTPTLENTPRGTVLIKATYTTICGSDMLYIQHPRNLDYCHGGSVHEVLGEVIGLSDMSWDESGLNFRDIVLALPTNVREQIVLEDFLNYVQCGIYRGVDEETKLNIQKLPANGGLCEYFLSHMSHIFKIPNNPLHVPLHYFLAAQPLGTLLWMVRKAPNLLFKSVLVYGAGQNGCLLVQLLSNMGARHVIAVDVVPERLEAARQMKATHTFLSDDPDKLCQQVKEVTNGNGVDIVYEMVGHQQDTLIQCIQLVKEGGTVVGFGVPGSSVYAEFPFSALFRRNVSLTTSVFPTAKEDFPFAVEMIAQKRIDPAALFQSPWYSLDTSDAAFVDTMSRKPGVLKVVIDLQKSE